MSGTMAAAENIVNPDAFLATVYPRFSPMPEHDKSALAAALRARIQADLEAVTASQRESHAATTHEEARPEDDKDTRAIESSYLARGLARRVAELRTAAARLQHFAPPVDAASIAMGALVALEDEQGAQTWYFLAPAGGGVDLRTSGEPVRVITPDAPLARALLGKEEGDEIEVSTPGGKRLRTVAVVR